MHATYYAPLFNGRPTITGERFDPRKFTAASCIHPPGTILRVVNRDNGRAVFVRVNDRLAPAYCGDRIDLTRRAFERIGERKAGKLRVTVSRVEPEEVAEMPMRRR